MAFVPDSAFVYDTFFYFIFIFYFYFYLQQEDLKQ